MFGLWYLSLAIDELRKHFGWSSIFDAFKSTKTDKSTKTSNKAIEDKKPSDNATENKNQLPKQISRPAPEPPKQTIVEPPKPKLEPTKPAPDPPKPVVEIPKSAPEPPKPVVDLPKSAPEPPKPLIESPKPVIEPHKPITPPKSPSPPKPSTPTKQITPPVTPLVNTPKKEPSPPQPKTQNTSPSANSNNFDRNMFTPSKKLENGDGPGNIKDATTSFLQEEGRSGSQGPNKSQSTPSNVNFKQL